MQSFSFSPPLSPLSSKARLIIDVHFSGTLLGIHFYSSGDGSSDSSNNDTSSKHDATAAAAACQHACECSQQSSLDNDERKYINTLLPPLPIFYPSLFLPPLYPKTFFFQNNNFCIFF